MAKGKRADLEKQFMLWSQAFRTLNHVITAAMWVLIAYFTLEAIRALAGETTSIWAFLSLSKSNYGLPWVVVVILIIWALSERKLRLRKTKSMEDHVKRLETTIDPGRSSSELTPMGQTNPRDR